MSTDYIGRFAPSPTGRLHIGSLLAAVASFLDARSAGGTWLVRMEDLDPPREMAGAAEDILRTLEAFALYWDQPVVYQSRRHCLYRAALEKLREKKLIYPCSCSRKSLQASCAHGLDGVVYHGHCWMQHDAVSTHPAPQTAQRIIVTDEEIGFHDAVVGDYAQNLAREIGDFVLLRADGMWAYQLAVVVDDAEQGITHVVRGQDLLVSTPRQIYLQRCLGYPTPYYAHLPLLTNHAGQKWSKQTRAAALDVTRKEALLRQVLAYLHLPEPVPDADCETLLRWAVAHWVMARVPPAAMDTEQS